MNPTVRSDVEIHPDTAQLAVAAAERFIAAATAAIRATGRFSVALSGGSTPGPLFATLAATAYSTRVPWPDVHVFWGDERCVPPDDIESNYGMARELLLGRVPVPASNVHRIRGEDDPPAAAARYESDLRDAFGTPCGPPLGTPGKRFDLLLLGLGANGHTASLFPHLQAVREPTKWVMAERMGVQDQWRITLTPPILNQAAEILFLVSGREKAAALRRVLCDARDTDELPAQSIAPEAGRVRWLVDVAAAADLPSP
ncbi:MAG TPA: 6-phosphogluconolactonase [Gemmatimonadaceae bacterium]